MIESKYQWFWINGKPRRCRYAEDTDNIKSNIVSKIRPRRYNIFFSEGKDEIGGSCLCTQVSDPDYICYLVDIETNDVYSLHSDYEHGSPGKAVNYFGYDIISFLSEERCYKAVLVDLAWYAGFTHLEDTYEEIKDEIYKYKLEKRMKNLSEIYE